MSARIRRLSPSARTCVFVKQSPGPLLCNPQTPRGASPLYIQGHPFSRSYGVSLPSSLTRDLPSASRRLPPPTCVGLRYGQAVTPPGRFLAPQARSDRLWVAPPALDHLSGATRAAPHGLRRGLQPHAPPTSKRSLASSPTLSSRGLHCCLVQEYKPVVHRLRVLPPRLRPD